MQSAHCLGSFGTWLLLGCCCKHIPQYLCLSVFVHSLHERLLHMWGVCFPHGPYPVTVRELRALCDVLKSKPFCKHVQGECNDPRHFWDISWMVARKICVQRSVLQCITSP